MSIVSAFSCILLFTLCVYDNVSLRNMSLAKCLIWFSHLPSVELDSCYINITVTNFKNLSSVLAHSVITKIMPVRGIFVMVQYRRCLIKANFDLLIQIIDNGDPFVVFTSLLFQ